MKLKALAFGLLVVAGLAPMSASAPADASASPAGYEAFVVSHLATGTEKAVPPAALTEQALTIDDGGIGPFRLGMGVDAVVALAGKPRSIHAPPDEAGRAIFVVSRGRSVFTFCDGRLVAVALGTGDFPHLRVRGLVIGRELTPANAAEKLGADVVAGPTGRVLLPLGERGIFGFNPSRRREAGDPAEVYYVDLRDRAHFGITAEKIAEARARGVTAPAQADRTAPSLGGETPAGATP